MGLPARRIQQQFSLVGSLYRLVDATAVAGGLALAVWVARLPAASYLLPGAIAIIVHYLVAEIAGMYRSWRGVSGNREAYLKLSTWGLAFLIVAGIGFASERLEEYPRMDPLIEVEGSPEAIERALASIGLPRSGFTSGRLPDFVADFEARTGQRAALSARELAGDYGYRLDDA